MSKSLPKTPEKTAEPHRRIVELRTEGIKRIRAVRIRPQSDVIQVVGKNKNGKSSVLNSIWWCLDGARNIQKTPIRLGEESAFIQLDLGDLLVTRRFTAKEGSEWTTDLKIEGTNGAVYRSPQAMLDSFIRALAFEPLKLLTMEPREQARTIEALVPGFDHDEYRVEQERDRARRTEVNREIRRLQGQISGVEDPAQPDPGRVDEEAIATELESAGQQATARVTEEARRENIARECAALERTLDGIEAEIARLQETRHNVEVKRVGLAREMEAWTPLPERVDTGAVRDRLAMARRQNALHSSWAQVTSQRERLDSQLGEQQILSEDLSAEITARDQRRADAIAAAGPIVSGLSFGEHGVMLNDLPLDQASTAEQIGLAVSVASALNPPLRVILVRDGSSLDDESLEILEKFALEHDMQVWVERVGTSVEEGMGVLIVDGMVDGRMPVDEPVEEEEEIAL